MLRFVRHNSKSSALAERFQQIVDEKLPHSSPSLVDKDPSLKKIYNQYSDSADRQFRDKYQQHFAYAKSENLLRGKEARELADTINNPPWRGEENVYDTAARMVADSVAKPKPLPRQKTIISPPVPVHQRLGNAREASLDYKVSKDKTPQDIEREQFREMYQERLVGPSMFLNVNSPHTTLGMATSLADARINAAIDRDSGKFNTLGMDAVRGKPLDRERLANSTDSNFFTNQILNNQDCLPPWIESQQGVDRDRESFRLDLQKKWFNLVISDLTKQNMQQKEVQGRAVHINKETYLPKFKSLHGRYIKAKLDLLNQAIRTYNLQSPSSSLHKWKLQEEMEISRLFDAVKENLPQLIQEWFEQQNSSRKIHIRDSGDKGSLFGLFDLGGKLGYGSGGGDFQVVERPPPPKLEIWKLLKDMFKMQ